MKWQVPAKSKKDGWYEIPKWLIEAGAIPYPRDSYTLPDGTVAGPEQWIELRDGSLSIVSEARS